MVMLSKKANNQLLASFWFGVRGRGGKKRRQLTLQQNASFAYPIPIDCATGLYEFQYRCCGSHAQSKQVSTPSLYAF